MSLMRALYKIVAAAGGTMFSIWLILLIFHLLVPNALVNKFSENTAKGLAALFEPIDNIIAGKSDSAETSKTKSEVLPSFLGTCYPDIYRQWFSEYEPSAGDIDKIQGRETKLVWEIVTLEDDIDKRVSRDRTDVIIIRNKSLFFSTLLILLGMATTIFSALNSADIDLGRPRPSKFIKIISIVLPASLTAVAAFGALFAPSDEIARKGQALYNLTGLLAEIDTSLTQAACPLVTGNGKIQNLDAYEQSLISWNKSFAGIIATADYGQVSSNDQKRPKGAGNNPSN